MLIILNFSGITDFPLTVKGSYINCKGLLIIIV